MQSFAWAGAWLILSSIEKTMRWRRAGEAVWGGRVPQQVPPPSLTTPPFLPNAQATPSFKTFDSKASLPLQHTQIASLRGAGREGTQAVMRVMEGNL